MPRSRDQGRIARELGAQIHALRLKAELTQEKLAWRCDLNKGYLSQIEAGKRIPSVMVLIELARELNVPVVSFFEDL